jgi:basic membrane protein A
MTKELINGTLKNSDATRYYDLKSEGTGITDLATISGYIANTEAAKAKWTEIKNKVNTLAEKIKSGQIKVTDAQKGEALDKSKLPKITFVN